MNSNTTNNIDELIPEMFDQMRSNFENEMKSPMSLRDRNTKLSSSTISTQSLLKELEALDKIIPMIENINRNMQHVLPSHIAKIQETCKNTNMILDSWIDIHSQAGYVHQLMTKQQLHGDSDNDAIEREKAELKDLKKILEEEQRKKTLIEHNKFNSKGTFSGNKSSSNIRKIQKSTSKDNRQLSIARNAYRGRASNIPNISSRLTKPTASSQRKMFK